MTVARFSEQFELLINRQTDSETSTLIIWSTACLLGDWPTRTTDQLSGCATANLLTLIGKLTR